MTKSYEVKIKHYPEEAPNHFDEIIIVERSVKDFHSNNCMVVLYPNQSKPLVEGKYREDYFELKREVGRNISHPGSSRGSFYYINLTEMYRAVYDKDMFELSPMQELANSITEKNRDKTQPS